MGQPLVGQQAVGQNVMARPAEDAGGMKEVRANKVASKPHIASVCSASVCSTSIVPETPVRVPRYDKPLPAAAVSSASAAPKSSAARTCGRSWLSASWAGSWQGHAWGTVAVAAVSARRAIAKAATSAAVAEAEAPSGKRNSKEVAKAAPIKLDCKSRAGKSKSNDDDFWKLDGRVLSGSSQSGPKSIVVSIHGYASFVLSLWLAWLPEPAAERQASLNEGPALYIEAQKMLLDIESAPISVWLVGGRFQVVQVKHPNLKTAKCVCVLFFHANKLFRIGMCRCILLARLWHRPTTKRLKPSKPKSNFIEISKSDDTTTLEGFCWWWWNPDWGSTWTSELVDTCRY